MRLAQPRGARDQRAEHGVEVERRAADRLEELPYRGLLGGLFGKLELVRLQLGEAEPLRRRPHLGRVLADEEQPTVSEPLAGDADAAAVGQRLLAHRWPAALEGREPRARQGVDRALAVLPAPDVEANESLDRRAGLEKLAGVAAQHGEAGIGGDEPPVAIEQGEPGRPALARRLADRRRRCARPTASPRPIVHCGPFPLWAGPRIRPAPQGSRQPALRPRGRASPPARTARGCPAGIPRPSSA